MTRFASSLWIVAMACRASGPAERAHDASGIDTAALDAPSDAAQDAVQDASLDAAIDGRVAVVGVVCGMETCQAPAYCLICRATDPSFPRSCAVGPPASCDTLGAPPMVQECDGSEDCAGGTRCSVNEGDTILVRCTSATHDVVCRDSTECPAPAACVPYARGYEVRVCR